MTDSGSFISFHQALMKLSHSAGFINESRERKLTSLARLCARTLDVGRVSIWQFSHGGDRLTCEWLYELGTEHSGRPAIPSTTAKGEAMEGPLVFYRDEHPNYFQALAEARVVEATDAETDPRTTSFKSSYLSAVGIKSMLDAPIFDGSRLSGVICLESLERRQWSLPELSFVVSVADTISLVNTHQAWLHSKEKLDYLTRYDPLTGLLNLDSLRDRIRYLISKIERRKLGCFTLMWIDLDRFKVINDGLGPQAGDEVLAEIGRRLAELPISGKDLLARIGGDEYAMLVRNNTEPNALDNISAVIRSEISNPIRVGEQTLNVTASLGLCRYPGDGEDAGTLLRSAEAAMYHAKLHGKGQAYRFDTSIQTTARSRFALERELRDTIQDEALDVFYQPIFDHTGTRLESLEALVRWCHPERGWLSPIEFLDIARSASLMLVLGECVLRKVCGHWQQANHRNIALPVITVNLAAEQVLSSELPTLVEGICREFGMPQHALHFEVTEDSIQGDSAVLRKTLGRLVEAGSELAIDDFGTGYSSLSRLKSLPFSKIKIDRSFISHIPEDEDDCAITLSIIGLARGLGLSVVAEGVETRDHEQWLQQQGCEYLQGYRYSKPLPFEELISRYFSGNPEPTSEKISST